MIPNPDLKSKRNRGRSGATVIELAIMILPTFSVIFGFFDIGFAIFTWNTLQNAAREGTRYAITYQTQSGLGQVQSIKNETARWAMGFVSSSTNSTSGAQTPWIEVAFYTQGGVQVTGSGGNVSNNIVEVSVRNYPYRWLFPFSGSMSGAFYEPLGGTLSIAVYSADVLGGYGLSTGPPAM